jgi:hypothetical protein
VSERYTCVERANNTKRWRKETCSQPNQKHQTRRRRFEVGESGSLLLLLSLSLSLLLALLPSETCCRPPKA